MLDWAMKLTFAIACMNLKLHSFSLGDLMRISMISIERLVPGDCIMHSHKSGKLETAAHAQLINFFR